MNSQENNKIQNDEILKALNTNDIIKQYNLNVNTEQVSPEEDQNSDENNLNINRTEEQLKIIQENSKVSF